MQAPRACRHCRGVSGDDNFVCTKPPGVVDLAGMSREEDDVRTHGVGELDRHVPQAAEPDDADRLPRTCVPVAKRRVRRDARAQQRRRGRQLEPRRHAKDEVLVGDDALRVATVGHATARLVRAVVRQDHVRAGPLELSAAGFAVTARPDQAAYRGRVSRLESRDLGSDRRDTTHDLVPRDDGKHGELPVVARHVEVGVTNATEQDLELHVARTGLPPVQREGSERRRGVRGCIREGLGHSIPPIFGIAAALRRLARPQIRSSATRCEPRGRDRSSPHTHRQARVSPRVPR